MVTECFRTGNFRKSFVQHSCFYLTVKNILRNSHSSGQYDSWPFAVNIPYRFDLIEKVIIKIGLIK